MSPSTVIAQFYVDVLPVEQRLSWLPPLQHTFASWHTAGATEGAPILDRREAVLGTATLSCASLRLLYEIASLHIQALHPLEPLSAWHTRPLHERIAFHAASYSAAQTQAVLPPGVLVQKTVTVAMAGRLLLCTCVGDRKLERTHLRAVAHELALPRRAARRCTINPSTCDPVVEYGMLPGMVSSFVSPLRKTRVAAVVLLPWPRRWEEQGREVAVSLSLWESLLLPLRSLRDSVRAPIRLHSSSSYRKRKTMVTNSAITHLHRPMLVPVVDPTLSDERDQQHVATLLATAITRRVERLYPVTMIEPVAVSDVEAGLKHLLHQGMQQIVLVPWCLLHASTDLMSRAASVLQQARPGKLDITTMQRPLVPVHGATPMGPLGGLICVQERLDPYVALLPGWPKVYTCLQAGQTHLLLLCARHTHTLPQRSKDISSLEIALLYELCSDQGEPGVPRLDAMLVRDGAIYAGYLVQLLCAVIETAFPHVVLSRCAAM